MREFKANPAIVIMGRLMWRIRMEDMRRAKAKGKRPGYRQTRRDHARVSVPRW